MAYIAAQKHFPAGIFTALSKCGVVVVIIASIIIFKEQLHYGAFIWIGITTICGLSLAFTKTKWWKNFSSLWLIFIVIKLLTSAIRYFRLTYYSKNMDRARSAYLYEALALLWIWLFFLLKKFYYYSKKSTTQDISINSSDIHKLLSYYMLTVPASMWLLSYANTLWPGSINSAITSITPLRVMILSYFYYKEKLTFIQVICIIWIIIWVCIIKIYK